MEGKSDARAHFLNFPNDKCHHDVRWKGKQEDIQEMAQIYRVTRHSKMKFEGAKNSRGSEGENKTVVWKISCGNGHKGALRDALERYIFWHVVRRRHFLALVTLKLPPRLSTSASQTPRP